MESIIKQRRSRSSHVTATKQPDKRLARRSSTAGVRQRWSAQAAGDSETGGRAGDPHATAHRVRELERSRTRYAASRHDPSHRGTADMIDHLWPSVGRSPPLRRVAVEGQVQLKAVWQKLHGTRELLGAVAEGPEHGGGVGAQGHGITVWGRGPSAPRPRGGSKSAVQLRTKVIKVIRGWGRGAGVYGVHQG